VSRSPERGAAQVRSGRARPGTAEAPEAAGTAGAAEAAEAAEADASEPSASASPGWQRPAWMSWKALAALGVGGFLIAMLAITGLELAVGQPLAGVIDNQVSSGRSTTFGEVARGDGGQRERSNTPTSSVDTNSTSQTTGSTVPGSTVPGSTGATVPATSSTAPGLQQPPATTAPPSATTQPAGG
jgi:hypothetical protein